MFQEKTAKMPHCAVRTVSNAGRVFRWASVTFGGRADPVEVSRELLGNVRLPASREAHHHDDGRRVGKVGRASCCREGERVRSPFRDRGHRTSISNKPGCRQEICFEETSPKSCRSPGFMMQYQVLFTCSSIKLLHKTATSLLCPPQRRGPFVHSLP